MTYLLIYNSHEYELDVDDAGEPVELRLVDSGPGVNVPITTLPGWLLQKVQDWHTTIQ